MRIVDGVTVAVENALTQTSARVAIVAPSAYPLGGVQTWLDYLVPGLESVGWNVTVVLVDGPQSNAKRYVQTHPFRQVHLVTNFTGSREGRVRALASTINSIRPNLVLGVNIADVYEAVARVRQTGDAQLKVAIALHGLQPCFYGDVSMYKTVIDGAIATNRLAVAAATQIGGAESARAFYAPCGVSVPALAAPICTDGDLTLLYAGRFDSDEKRVLDLPLILDALDRLQVGFRLRLAGSGPAEWELREALKKFGDRVEFVGVLNEGTLQQSFYCAGSVLLIMSPSETGPLVAWEAMANGVALVTSEFMGIGIEGSLRNGENCLTFPIGDAEAAAIAISRLTDPMRRQTLVRSGYRVVTERYSRESSVAAWNSAMRKILTLPRRIGVKESKTPIQASAGRLDLLFGTRLAETLRRLLRIRFQHASAGAEWPHSYSDNARLRFYELLNLMDKTPNSDGNNS